MTEYKGCKSSIYLMPINYLEFEMVNDISKKFIIYELEKESNYKITNYGRNTDFGTIKKIGYKLEGNFYVPHNLYSSNNLLGNLENFMNKPTAASNLDANHLHVTLKLGETAINSYNDMTILICNLNGSVGLTYEIEGVEFRPRLIIHLVHICKTNGMF